MIRVEIVVKDQYGYVSQALERKIKREIVSTVNDVLDDNNAEPVRIQFLGPKKS